MIVVQVQGSGSKVGDASEFTTKGLGSQAAVFGSVRDDNVRVSLQMLVGKSQLLFRGTQLLLGHRCRSKMRWS